MKKKIIIVIASILIIIGLVGLTYAFFTNNVIGNDEAKGTVVETGKLSIKYTNSNELRGTNVMPGWTESKTFTVENTGTATAVYNISWNNLLNEFINKEDLVYTLSSDNNGGNLSETILEDSGEHIDILSGIEIESGVVQTYTLTVSYKNKDKDQTSDAGKKLIGKIEVLDGGERVSSEYSVKVEVENGSVDKEEQSIKRKEDGVFNLVPNVGYKKADVSCSNSQNAEFKDNVLIVKKVVSDTVCKVSYKINNYSVNLSVVNGISSEQVKTGNHGDNIVFNVNGNTGYVEPVLSCSNNQSGIVQGNTLTINNISSDTSCTLEYKPLSYQIKYNSNGGTGTMVNSSYTYDESKALSSNTFTRVGYEFLGWSRNKDASEVEHSDNQSIKNLTTTSNEVIELYAIWKIKTYTVNVTVLNGIIDGSTSKTGNHGDNIVFNVNGNTGYVEPVLSCSNNQSGTVQGNTLTINNISSDTSCTLEYKPLSYQIKYNSNGGTGTMANSNHVYDESKALSSNTFTRVGYEFFGWSRNKDASEIEYSNGQSIKNLTTTSNEVIELYAIWKIKTYTVNVTVLNGIIDGETSKTINHGSNTTFNLIPSEGYGDPIVSCTNGQSGTIENNILIINNVTGDTTCTVSFQEINNAAKDIIAKYSEDNTEGLIKIDQPATVQTKETTEYRYSGSDDVVKNYATFNDQNWRIIGVFDVDDGTGKIEKRIKIIREASLGDYSWDSTPSNINNGYGSNQWGPTGSYPGADLMQELNDTYYNSKSGTCYNSSSNGSTGCYFITTGLKEESRKMIDNAKWYTGASPNSTTVANHYATERSNTVGSADSGQSVTKTSNWTGKIGLMYPSDYGYATSGGNSSNLNTCKNTNIYNWDNSSYSFCKNNDWLKLGSSEWTLAPYESINNGALYVVSTGYVSGAYTYNTIVVRPTLYLKHNVQITKGTGTSSDRYEFGM